MANSVTREEASSVQEICDELWNCQGPSSVLGRLKDVHHAILTGKFDNYDASEAFLAIQGAALRFRPSLNPQDSSGGEELDAEAMHWPITEEALLAAAALACVCVGPAWHAQRKIQRRFLLARTADGDQSTFVSSAVDPPEDVGQDSSEARSYSPLTDPAVSTLYTESVNEGSTDAVSYPRIPEVLPAALLRHAASLLKFLPEMDHKTDSETWDHRRARIAIGQRHLVLALCCEGADWRKAEGQRANTSSEASPMHWSIPGANELVGQMVLYWLSITARFSETNKPSRSVSGSSESNGGFGICSEEVSPFDEWYVLAATRATVDLLSVGWRPLRTNECTQVINHLLAIATTGISNLESLWNEEVARIAPLGNVEYLTVLSSSAEAISALAAMGSRGLIPPETEYDVLVAICRLHVFARLIKVALLAPNEHFESSTQDRRQFLNQIDSCFADTWEVLLTLCNSTTSSTPLETMLKIIAVSNPRSPNCQLFLKQEWGAEEKVACLSSGTALRVLSAAIWGSPRGMSIPVHLRVHMSGHLGLIREIAASIHEILQARMNDGSFLSKSTLDLLPIVLDTVVSLGDFCNQQIAGGGELISIVEWDTFLLAVEEAFVPWLGYELISKTWDDVELSEHASKHFEGILKVLQRSHIEAQALMLRVGALLDKSTRNAGNPFHSIVEYESQRRLYLFITRKVIPVVDPTDGELLGLSVSRAWVKFGLFPFRPIGWFETASEILNEFFRCSDDGWHVFSPNVRLATFVALENSINQNMMYDGIDGTVLGEVSDYHIQITKAIAATVERSLSLLTSRNLEEERRGSLVTGFRDGAGDTQPPAFRRANGTFNTHVVRMAGALLRDGSVTRDRRRCILTHLQTLASQTPNRIAPEAPGATIESCHQSFSLPLDVIRELDESLGSSFRNTSSDSWMLSRLVESLLCILRDVQTDIFTIHGSTLCIYIVSILGRIRPSCRNETVVFLDWKVSLADASEHVLATLEVLRRLVDRLPATVGGAVCTPKALHTTLPVEIDFKRIVENIVDLLGASSSASQENASRYLLQLSLLCHHIISTLWLSGVPLGGSELRVNFLTTLIGCAKNASPRSRPFSARSLGAFIQQRVSMSLETDLASGEHDDDIGRSLDIFRQSFHLYIDAVELITASRALLPALPALSKTKVGANFLLWFFRCLVNKIHLSTQAEVTSVASDEKVLDAMENDRHSSNIVLLDLAQEIMTRIHEEIPAIDLVNLFDVCKAILFPGNLDFNASVFHVALRCLAATVEVLPVDNVTGTKREFVNECSATESNSADSEAQAVGGLPLPFVRRFIVELLDQTLDSNFTPRPSDDGQDCIKAKNGGQSLLDDLAIEIEFLEEFEAEKDDTGVEVSSSWFDGNCQLLTLRLGSSKSRFRGQMEVVLRCPTRRSRKLIRMPPYVSLRNPHCAPTLWSAPETHPYSVEHENLPPSLSLIAGTEKVLKDYEALISRFDALFPPSSQEAPVEVEAGTEVTPAKDSVAPDTDIQSGQDGVVSVSHTGNVSEWLATTLENNMSSVDAVVSGLRELGIADELILDTSCGTFENDVESIKCLRRVQPGPKSQRAMAVLDRTIPCNTHKVGLLYGGPSPVGLPPDNSEEFLLLSNEHSSPAFHAFANSLGRLVRTRNLRFFSAGLDVSNFESDGHFTRASVDESPTGSDLLAARTIVVYHVPSLMPPGLNNRKRHIGNDTVLIVFLDKDFDTSSHDFDDVNSLDMEDGVVTGQFDFATIYVSVLPSATSLMRVTVKIRKGLPSGLHRELRHFAGTSIIDRDEASAFVRRLATQIDLVCRSKLDNLGPSSNSLERYRMLRQMSRFC